MRVLVTGGAGFIGSHVCDHLLAAGHEVAALDDLSSGSRRNLSGRVTLYEGDVRDARFVELVFSEVKPDRVCHQAAQVSVSRSVREPRFDAEVNVLGLLNVLEASARHGADRVVFASTGGALYGDVFEPVPETAPADPASPYGVSKLAGEGYLRAFARDRGLPAVALRYANVYGPRQDPHGEAGVIAIFTRALLNGETCTINGDGRYVRDYVYVDDVAHANVLALERDATNGPSPFAAYNIGTGSGTDVNTLFESLRALAAPGARAAFGPPRPGDLRSSLLDSSKAGRELGWRPSVPLEEGLRATVAWFRRERERTAPARGGSHAKTDGDGEVR